jgi:hypothetical protein
VTSGNWKGATNKYLGLAFQIHGKTHYGWARLTTHMFFKKSATLTGYAYETIAGKSIITGKTMGATDDLGVGLDEPG